jgi:hypothetical protein
MAPKNFLLVSFQISPASLSTGNTLLCRDGAFVRLAGGMKV